jgi:hypothetical protein
MRRGHFACNDTAKWAVTICIVPPFCWYIAVGMCANNEGCHGNGGKGTGQKDTRVCLPLLPYLKTWQLLTLIYDNQPRVEQKQYVLEYSRI